LLLNTANALINGHTHKKKRHSFNKMILAKRGHLSDGQNIFHCEIKIFT